MPTVHFVVNWSYMYLREKQEEITREEGRPVSISKAYKKYLKTITSIPEHEKERYKELARQFKKTDEYKELREKSKRFKEPKPLYERERRDCTGGLLEDWKDPQTMFSELRTQSCVFLLEEWSVNYSEFPGDIRDELFYFIAVEPAVCDDKKFNYPCEIALVEFSLSKGITNTLHFFVGAVLPSGLEAEARVVASQRHRVDPTDFKHFNSNYEEILSKILEYMNPWRALHQELGPEADPRLYCLGSMEQRQSVVDSLAYLKQKSYDPTEKENRLQDVWCIEDLIRCLCEWIDEPISDELISQINFQLRRPKYNYARGFRCFYHDSAEVDTAYCALNAAMGLCAKVSEYMEPKYHLTITPQHIPDFQIYETGKRDDAMRAQTQSTRSVVTSSAAPKFGQGTRRISSSRTSASTIVLPKSANNAVALQYAPPAQNQFQAARQSLVCATAPAPIMPLKLLDITKMSPEDLVACMTGGPNVYCCEMCGVSCNGMQPFRNHLEGAKHLKNLNSMAPKRQPSQQSVVDNTQRSAIIPAQQQEQQQYFGGNATMPGLVPPFVTSINDHTTSTTTPTALRKPNSFPCSNALMNAHDQVQVPLQAQAYVSGSALFSIVDDSNGTVRFVGPTSNFPTANFPTDYAQQPSSVVPNSHFIDGNAVGAITLDDDSDSSDDEWYDNNEEQARHFRRYRPGIDRDVCLWKLNQMQLNAGLGGLIMPLVQNNASQPTATPVPSFVPVPNNQVKPSSRRGLFEGVLR